MPETKRSLKVFLCHAHADRDAVRALYTRLTKDGVDAWLDKEKLLPGQDWEYEIRKAVREADVVLVCLSKQFNQAGFRQKEVRLALDTAMEKPEGDIFIIPARLEECDTLESLRKWNWVDLFEPNGYEVLLKALQVRADQAGVTINWSLSAPAISEETGKKQAPKKKYSRPKEQHLATTKDRHATKRPKSTGKPNTAIIVALISLAGTIIAAVLGSPLMGNLFSPTTPTATNTFSIATEIIPAVTPSRDLTGPSPTSIAETTHTTSSIYMSLLESFSAPGTQAEGITWDGVNLWLSDNSGMIFKLDPSGNVLDSFLSPEVTPQGMTWDGSSFWVFTTNQFFIYQFRADDGKAQTLNSFRSPAETAGGGLAQDMAWDGENLWFANQFKVYHLDKAGNVLSYFVFPRNVTGLDWDGSNLWLAYNDFPKNATINIVDTTGKVLDAYPSLVYEVNGLAWAGDYVWVLGRDSLGEAPMIYKVGVTRK